MGPQVEAPRIKVLPKHVELNFTKREEKEWLGLPNAKREKASKKATRNARPSLNAQKPTGPQLRQLPGETGNPRT